MSIPACHRLELEQAMLYPWSDRYRLWHDTYTRLLGSAATDVSPTLIELADRWYSGKHVDELPMAPSATVTTCTCSLTDLMRVGCKCGGR